MCIESTIKSVNFKFLLLAHSGSVSEHSTAASFRVRGSLAEWFCGGTTEECGACAPRISHFS